LESTDAFSAAAERLYLFVKNSRFFDFPTCILHRAGQNPLSQAMRGCAMTRGEPFAAHKYSSGVLGITPEYTLQSLVCGQFCNFVYYCPGLLLQDECAWPVHGQ
jgi:hypothetical protein